MDSGMVPRKETRKMKYLLILFLLACGSPSGLHEITDTEAAKHAYKISSTLLGIDLTDIKAFSFPETNKFCSGLDSCLFKGEPLRYFMVIPTTPNHTCRLIMLAAGNTVYGTGEPWRNFFGAPLDPAVIVESWCWNIQ